MLSSTPLWSALHYLLQCNSLISMIQFLAEVVPPFTNGYGFIIHFKQVGINKKFFNQALEILNYSCVSTLKHSSHKFRRWVPGSRTLQVTEYLRKENIAWPFPQFVDRPTRT